MPRFLYVQAVVTRSLVESPEAITFRSREVEAPDADDAYHAGQVWADQFTYTPQAETVNDYVVEMQ